MGTDWNHIIRQLRIYRRNLAYLQDQAALCGDRQVPHTITQQIMATEAKIAELEEVLKLAKE